VRLTSAVELDPEIVKRVRSEIERQTGQTIELSSDVDEGIIGGLVLRVGNMVLDASLRSKLERLRKEVAQAA
jgi:F-type H+-transporting ATPase subunit delta